MGKVIRGAFGKLCPECDEIIPAARVRLNPKAKMCVDCQELADKKRKRDIDRALMIAKSKSTIMIIG